MEYRLEEPINIIFDTVEDLSKIEELTRRPYSPQQILDLGYIILSTNWIFRDNIRNWVKKPENEKNMG